MPTLHRPLISVVIPTYNRPQLVVRAIRSFLDQTYQRFEIIVVNDGGTDATAVAVTGMADQRVRYLDKPHGGLASARNWGLRKACGEYVTFCDDDDEVFPSRLEHHLAFAQRNGHRVSFCNAYLVENGRRRLFLKTPPGGSDFTGLFYRRNPPVHTFLAKRECLISAGGFNETLSVCEDYDLWLRLLPAERFGYLNEPLVLYHRHGEGMTHDRQLISRMMCQLAATHFRRHEKEFTTSFKRKFARLMLLRQTRRQLRAGNFIGAAVSSLRILDPRQHAEHSPHS